MTFGSKQQLSVLLTCAFMLWTLAAANTAVVEFSSWPADSVAAAAVTSSAGKDETDCATKCALLQPCECAATAFVTETKLCLFSAAWAADFSAAAPGRTVYRRRLETPANTSDVTIGCRVFRVIQQRSTGAVSFAQNWTEYETGFGDAADFWIGLRTIHELSGSSPRLLRVEAVTWSDVLFVCEYSGFSVGNASTNFTMTFDSYLTGSSNMTSDSLSYQKGMQFSSIDRDNDGWNDFSCSRYSGGRGGWWFNLCSICNPNGIYYDSRTSGVSSFNWKGADGLYSLKSMRLMLQL